MNLVAVTTQQGEAFRGRRRFAWFRPIVVLEQPEALVSGQDPARIQGRLEVPCRNVAYIQRLPEPLPQLEAGALEAAPAR